MSSRRRVAAIALLVAIALVAVTEVRWCPPRALPPPSLTDVRTAEGPLRVGAAKVNLQVPFPAVLAGYGPPRSEVATAQPALAARALVLEVGAVRVALVSVDLCTLPEELAQSLRSRLSSAGLQGLWAAATHAHTSVGGYARGVVSQIAGTGRFRPEVEAAVLDAMERAVREADHSLQPATLEIARGELGPEVYSRDEEPQTDRVLTEVRLRGADKTLGTIILLAAHPTLVDRHAPSASPDYPGVLADELQASGQGVTLVMQTAGGNASVAVPQQDRLSGFVAVLRSRLEKLHPVPVAGSVKLGVSRVKAELPATDASRLVPFWLARPATNGLCLSAPDHVEVSALQLGPLRLVSVPGEPTEEAARALRAAAHADRVVGLTNGYVGYIDTAARVKAAEGESRRQYFDGRLLDVLSGSAATASTALDSSGAAP